MNRWRADWVKWSEAKKHLRQREDRAAEKEARAAEKEARAAEKEARASDVASNKKEEWNLPLQVIGLAVAMLVVLATAWAAYEARKAVITSQHIASQQAKDSRDIALQQSAENKFTMAVTAISSKDPLQQVAGFMLLHSSVREEVNGAINKTPVGARRIRRLRDLDVRHPCIFAGRDNGRAKPTTPCSIRGPNAERNACDGTNGSTFWSRSPCDN